MAIEHKHNDTGRAERYCRYLPTHDQHAPSLIGSLARSNLIIKLYRRLSPLWWLAVWLLLFLPM